MTLRKVAPTATKVNEKILTSPTAQLTIHSKSEDSGIYYPAKIF